MAKEKINILSMGRFPGEADIFCAYDGDNKRVGIGIFISDKITEHTRSQIWKEWAKVWRGDE